MCKFMDKPSGAIITTQVDLSPISQKTTGVQLMSTLYYL